MNATGVKERFSPVQLGPFTLQHRVVIIELPAVVRMAAQFAGY